MRDTEDSAIQHECSRQDPIQEAAPDARPSPKSWGEAITQIIRLGEQWWAVSGHSPEYSTAIEFCPWCGIRLAEPDT